jgi:hypothetical protein
MELVLRLAWALAVTALCLVCLAGGVPLAGVAVVVAGVALRRSAESGRLNRLARSL